MVNFRLVRLRLSVSNLRLVSAILFPLSGSVWQPESTIPLFIRIRCSSLSIDGKSIHAQMFCFLTCDLCHQQATLALSLLLSGSLDPRGLGQGFGGVCAFSLSDYDPLPLNEGEQG